MTADIINLPVITRHNLPPERVLDAARDANLQGVVVLGYDQDGHEYMASSIAGGPEVVWLMERLKFELMTGMGDANE